MRRRSSIVLALAVLAVAGVAALAENSAGVSAIYKTSSVSKSEDHVSMTFTVRFMNNGDEPKSFTLIKLGDPANLNTFARWENVTVPAKGKLDKSERITVPANEYKRWKSGGTANLWMVQPDPEGTTRATALSAAYQAHGW